VFAAPAFLAEATGDVRFRDAASSSNRIQVRLTGFPQSNSA
jgi:hypothetical protein